MLKLYSTLTKKFYDESEREEALAAEAAIRKQYAECRKKALAEKAARDAAKKEGKKTVVKVYSNGKEIIDEEQQLAALENFLSELRDFKSRFEEFNNLFRFI